MVNQMWNVVTLLMCRLLAVEAVLGFIARIWDLRCCVEATC